VAEVLCVDPSAIGPKAGVTNTGGWDGIGHVNIMLILEEKAGGALATDKVAQLLTVAAITEFLAWLPAAGPAA
jgi:acyl carrier protein